jgi:hypothetical protein
MVDETSAPWDCRGKRRYPTLAEVQRALEIGKRTWGYPPARWYRCTVCDGYHLSAKREQPKGDLRRQERAFRENRRQREAARRRRSPFDVLKGLLEGDRDA